MLQHSAKSLGAFDAIWKRQDRRLFIGLGLRQSAIVVALMWTFGSGVDGTIRRMETAFDGQGNPYLVTNYDAATSGSVVNQIQRGYNCLGQMTTEWQAVNGAVNTSTSPKVQYAFSEMASAANHSRPTSMTYPNGRVLTYNYTSGLDSNISRLSSITDGATTLEAYSYLGAGTVVIRSHSQPGIDLTYVKQSGESDGSAGDKYIGFDAFGRVTDQRWRASSSDIERFGYGFDRDSNRLYRENLVSSTRSELYAYDNLNQLTTFSRGTLNGTKTGLTGSASRSQAWDFDAIGNFDSQTTDGTAQTRTHNKQNEMTAISGATTPTYDANGNQTKDETGRTFEYDGWNRLIRVKNSSGTTLATYEPDALGRRIQETRSGTTTDQYYSNQWQVLEERVSGSATLSYAWSPVYVDAMISRDRDTDANGSLDERLYPLADANFNVTAVVNNSGSVVERYLNDPYGTVGIYDASWGTRSSSSYAWNYNHQGGRLDKDSGLFGFRNRDLGPTAGRWMQLDPIGFAGRDANLYRGLSNSPTSNRDAMGLQVADAFELGLDFAFYFMTRAKRPRPAAPAAPAAPGFRLNDNCKGHSRTVYDKVKLKKVTFGEAKYGNEYGAEKVKVFSQAIKGVAVTTEEQFKTAISDAAEKAKITIKKITPDAPWAPGSTFSIYSEGYPILDCVDDLANAQNNGVKETLEASYTFFLSSMDKQEKFEDEWKRLAVAITLKATLSFSAIETVIPAKNKGA